MTESTIEQAALISRVAGKRCSIELADGQTVEAIVRGRLLGWEGEAPAVGDQVRVRLTTTEPLILSISPRRNEFVRKGLRSERQALFANADRALILASLSEPATKPAAIDRFLVAALRGGIEPVLVLTKTDLDEEYVRESALRELYESIQPKIFSVSNATGEGCAELAFEIRAGVTALVGNSGVGKSSLMNRLIPGLDLKTREISAWSGKGTHTTTTAMLVRFGADAALIDTPGMKSFVPYGIDRESLIELFPDLRACAADCRFANCRHESEPDCALQAAVANGALSAGRLRSYHRLLSEIARDWE